VIEEDIFTDAIMGENLSDSIIYFFAGEGFVFFMSDQKVTLVPEVVERARSYTNIHRWHRLFKSLR
jgi:hypothetical protein